MAQNTYDTQWKSIAKLENDGKTKEAQAAVEKIITSAKKENNTTQIVKASLYKYKYMMTLQEQSELKIVTEIKSSIAQASGNEKAILQSILAELYWQYYNENSWKFSNRTETAEKQSDDFQTWDLKTLFKEINKNYVASLENKELLQKTKLEDFKILLNEEKGSKVFRPTLYDLLANRAIDYFNDSKSNIDRPADAYSIDSASYFETATKFVTLKLDTSDVNSGDFNTIKIYQDLLIFRLKDKANLDALADADLKRIQFVKEHYYNKSENEALYFTALKRLKTEYVKCNTAATICNEIANYIISENQNKEEAQVSTVGSLKDALAICDEAIKNYPNTEGAKNCAALRETIFYKNLSITTEETVVPNEPFKALVNFKNISKIYLKIIPINYADKNKIFNLKDNETEKDIVKRLNAIKPIRIWSQNLPQTDDYLDHSTEIKIDKLANGFYAILASTNEQFLIDLGKEAVAVSTLFSSQISYVTKENNSQNYELYILDRNSGQPLKDAKVKFYKNEYDYKTRKYTRVDLGTARSDENGFISKKVEKKNNSNYYDNYFLFDITYADDFLSSDQTHYHTYYERQEPVASKQVHLFTDRKIYRPGQTIYFKGIITQQDGDKHKIFTNEKITVIFRDVNYQEIKTQEFTSNEFGSFTGSFTAPTAGLLGSMTLYTDYGSQYIQVEEYKRPKFEVTFDPIKKAYNLNDKVSATGKAVSYAGANLDNAEVKYTVRRTAQYPIWCWFGWRRPWFPQTPEKIIAVGTTKTDDNGIFTVDFKAIPDLSLDKNLKPYFNYEISVDVVDISGETHSAETSVRVGYLAIDANVYINDKIDNSKENNISVSVNNLNGQPESTDVTVKVYDLIEPLNPKKARLWTEPDKFILSKTEHDKYFQYEIYDKEDLMSNWQKGALLNTYTFNTGKQTEIKLAANSLQAGAYLIEFTCKDKNGNAIEIKKNFFANSMNDKTPEPKAFAYFNVDKYTAKPNETVQYQIGSSMTNAYAIIEVAFKGNIIEKKIVSINNEIKTFSVPIKDSYKGGIEINYALVNKNRNYIGHNFVDVPYENKSLNVEWQTFRDKLLPGAKEQWKLKITGPNKEKYASELLASMYDASLDAFLPHSFNFYLGQASYNGWLGGFGADCFGSTVSSLYASKSWNAYKESAWHNYDDLNLFGLSIGGNNRYYFRNYGFASGNGMAYAQSEMAMDATISAPAPTTKKSMMLTKDETEKSKKRIDDDEAPNLGTVAGQKLADSSVPSSQKKPEVTPRTNLNETAFFLPQLQTDADGNVILNFQMPEALTKWNFLGLAHTKDLHYQYFTKSVVTQKELMVTPNAPRFLREGDKIEFTTKISNLSDKDLSGKTELILYDAATMKVITPKIMDAVSGFLNSVGERDFSVEKGKNTVVSWTLRIPSDVDAITYKVIAQADNFSDGEQASLIVLPNRMMVTETLPLWVRGESKKSYTFDKLLNTKSTTLKNYSLTLEMSSQPVWYAVQSLPYMMEYPHECAEQLFSRYYANTLASYIANQNPKIKTIFDKWKNTDALISNLEKNQELKSVLLEETPWVREAQNETEQKKRIALLFDLSKMADEKQRAFDKLIQMQTPNGGFTWFPGMPDNRYITQHIVAGFGHLERLDVIKVKDDPKVADMLQKAIAYLDDRLREDLENIKKYDKDYLKNNHLYYNNIHALYARSFFDQKIEKQNQEAYDYFIKQAKDYWLNQDLYSKGMLSLILQRNKEKSTADKIITSLKQNAINSEELGMYWKANETGGWYWYQAPIETQALLIEAFHEVANDTKSVDELKVWLLKQKQTTNWKSTKATAEACYALLLQGKDWTKSDQLVEVSIDNKVIDPVALGGTVEPGTGYYKIKWKAEQIQPSMAKIQLKKKDKGPAWGAMYWQYFEDLDKITGAETSLKLTKKLFKEESTKAGKVLIAIDDKTVINPGDLIKVRIELRTDRNMEYVHMKDMRAAGFEPINVLSQYKYQDGLGYYESTKDVATHFFMDWLPKGIYVFEYELRATLAGNFSNGITEIESMYAPEFKSHSKGERVTILKK
jgi:uncharacterized protein YfaS (alpha-2-macroglobulin family)/ribosomal protein L17